MPQCDFLSFPYGTIRTETRSGESRKLLFAIFLHRRLFPALALRGEEHVKPGIKRRGVVALAAASSAIGFALSAYFQNPYLAMAALTLAFVGLKCTVAPFWAMTTTFLSGTAAAATQAGASTAVAFSARSTPPIHLGFKSENSPSLSGVKFASLRYPRIACGKASDLSHRSRDVLSIGMAMPLHDASS